MRLFFPSEELKLSVANRGEQMANGFNNRDFLFYNLENVEEILHANSILREIISIVVGPTFDQHFFECHKNRQWQNGNLSTQKVTINNE